MDMSDDGVNEIERRKNEDRHTEQDEKRISNYPLLKRI